MIALDTNIIVYAHRPGMPDHDRARACLEEIAAPGCSVLAESGDHWPRLAGLVDSAGVSGPRIYDARIAAACLAHGVRELWTADRDYSRFPALRTRNPLVG